MAEEVTNDEAFDNENNDYDDVNEFRSTDEEV